MKEKRAQARRAQNTRRLAFEWLKPMLTVLTLVCSAIGLTLMLNWMQDAGQWPVRTVRVEGQLLNLDREALQQEVMPLAVSGFFNLDVSLIQQRVERMPWVSQVSVRRVWPDQLTVRVLEQKPVARWGEQGFLNAKAQLFEPEQTVDLPGLPQLQGPQGYEERVLSMYQRLLGMLQPLQLGIDNLRLDARRTWQVRLSNGLTIEVGRTDPVDRVARFVRVYPAILATGNGQVVAVDLRYSNGFTVRWQQTDETTRSTG
jgi:cell division protein FtsQ